MNILKKTVCRTFLLLLILCNVAIAQTLELEKGVFAPGKAISVKFTTPAGFAANAWIGIIPSAIQHGSESVNDQHDLAYQYLNGQTSGTLTFSAPSQPGSYDFRMHDTDNNGKEVTSVSFTVAGTDAPATAASLTLDKEVVTPGESISVQFTTPAEFAANAWIGIIPSAIQHGSESVNDQHDLAYQYLNGQTSGTLTFKAPSQPGSYDFRMHNTDDNGKEVTSVTFTVAGTATPATAVSLTLDKKVVTPGEAIAVQFTTPAGFATNAWVGIIPSDVQHGSESVNDEHDLAYQYLNGQTSGTLTFNAPSQPGSYDFRMHDTDNNGKEVTSVTFTVK